MTTTTITVKGVKINTLIPPTRLEALVGPERPTLDVRLAGTDLVMRATLNGQTVRRRYRVVKEHGPDHVFVALQGNLKPPSSPGGPLLLDAAGLSASARTPKAE
jgi:hypothetical protein